MQKRTILIKMANYDIEKLYENYCKYYCQHSEDAKFEHMVKWRGKINEVVDFLTEELGQDLFTDFDTFDYTDETKQFLYNIKSAHEIVNRN